jgi:pyruvate dehydrogenase E1 component beta subunit
MSEKNVVTAIHDALHDEMASDDRMVVLGEDIGVRGGVFRITQGFVEEFGDQRVIDTPLAESMIVGLAIGMSLHGLLPVAEIEFADFIHPAFDQIVSEAARMRYRTNGDFGLPMVIRVPWGGGIHGALYHSQSIEAFYGHVPGLKVVAPSTPADAKALLLASIRDNDPVLFLENLALYNTKGEVPDTDEPAEIGRAAVTRPGRDITLIGYSRMARVALQVADKLAADEGIDAEVVDLRSLRPLDRPTIVESVKKTNCAVVLEDDWLTYGVGAEIAASISEGAFDYLDAPVRRVAMAEVPMPYAKPLELAALPSADDVVTVVQQTLDAVGRRRSDQVGRH